MCLCLAISQSYGYLRDRHSFPTRRSSDLAFGPGAAGGVGAAPCGEFIADAVPVRQCDGAHRGGGDELRSEEHTSELQSRENLVCRLLLEKKKNTNLTKH